MDHAIEQLRQYLYATIEVRKGLSRGEVEPEMKAYVEALNVMEKHEYGKAQTSLETVLNDFEE